MTTDVQADTTAGLLGDLAYWRRRGIECGRRNQPRRPGDSSPVRSELLAALACVVRAERMAFLEELAVLDEERGQIKRVLHEVYHQSSSDPRQQTVVPLLVEKDRDAAARRTDCHRNLLEVLELRLAQAHECDAVWRAANEAARDRRAVIDPTPLDVPDELTELPPDPYA
jgi:hypothetical protein